MFFAILITTFTGTLAFGIWKVVKKTFLLRNPELVYLTLRLVCLLYLVPIGYIWMQLTIKNGYLQMDGLWQANFSLAGILWILAVTLVCIWVVFTIHYVVLYIQKTSGQRKVYVGNVPEEDEAVIEEFLRVKKKLGIHRNIRLWRNDMLDSPMIQGVFFCSVILPYRKYSREELSVIFHHELMHYKSHDSFFKLCGVCASAVHNLNPVSGNIMGLLDEWSEYHCDQKTIIAISDELDAGRYFEVIVDSVGEMPDKRNEDYIFSMLCESQSRLERRIDYMKKYTKIKRATRGATALLAFAFVMTSVTTTYAAGCQMAVLHDYIYRGVELTTEESTDADQLEEFYLPASEDDTYDKLEYNESELELISPLLDEDEIVSFEWAIASKVRHLSPEIYVEEGQTIGISATASPASCLFWIGIQDSLNNVRFVQGFGTLSHEFAIEESGNYRVLVQNRDKVTITAVGSYHYYTPEEESTEETE